MNKSIKILIPFMSAFSGAMASVSIIETEGTFNALLPEFGHLSPMTGGAAWERGIIHNYYSFGTFDNPKYVEKEGIGSFEFEQNAMMKFLHLLFHEVQGSLNVVSPNSDNIAPQLNFNGMGKILGTIERHRLQKAKPQEKAAAKKAGKTTKEKTLKEELTEIIKFPESTAFVGNYAAASESSRKEKLRKKGSAFASSFDEALTLDAAFNTETARYAPFTTYTFFLAYVYRRADKKADFKEFFKGLQEGLGKDPIHGGLENTLNDAWLQSTFSKGIIPNFEALDVALKGGVAQPDSGAGIGSVTSASSAAARLAEPQHTQLNFEALANLYENFVAVFANTKTGMPKNIEYANVNFEGKVFANCMATTVRKLFNLVAFDPESGLYHLEKLNALGTLSPELEHFYATHNQDNFAEKQDVHEAWNLAVQNKPWVAYANCLDTTSKTVFHAPSDRGAYEGFITITDHSSALVATPEELLSMFPGASLEASYPVADTHFPVLKLHDKRYIININPSRYHLFELEPSYRNIIILFNELLGLNLFSKEMRSSEFARPDFVRHYLQELFTRLGWSIGNQEVLETIDQKDHSMSLVEIKIFTGLDLSATLEIYAGHGECSYISDTSSQWDEQIFPLYKPLSDIFAKLINNKQTSRLNTFLVNNFLILFLGDKKIIAPDFIHIFDMNLPLMLQNFSFFMNLRDSDSRKHLSEFFSRFLNDLLKESSFQKAETINLCKNILLKLFASFPRMEDFRYETIIINLIGNNHTLRNDPLFLKKIGMMENLALESVRKSPETVYQGYSLFETLATNDFSLDSPAIIEAMSIGLSDPKKAGRAVSFVRDLAQKAKAAPSMLSLAKDFEKRDQLDLAAEILKPLVKNDHGYEQARELAIAMLNRNEWNPSLQLLEKLVSKGQAYTEAEAAAVFVMDATDSRNWYALLEVFRALVDKGQAYPAALTAAIKAANPDGWAAVPAVQLFRSLIKQGVGLEEAINVGKTLAADPSKRAYWNEGVTLLADIANEFLIKEDWAQKQRGFELYEYLFERQWMHHYAHEFLKKKADPDLLATRLALEALLVKWDTTPGIRFMDDMKHAITSENLEVNAQYLALLATLVEKGKEYSTARRALFTLQAKLELTIHIIKLCQAFFDKGLYLEDLAETLNMLKQRDLEPTLQQAADELLTKIKRQIAAATKIQKTWRKYKHKHPAHSNTAARLAGQ